MTNKRMTNARRTNGRRARRVVIRHVPALLCALAAGAVSVGCGEHLVPVLKAVRTENVKPGDPCEAVVVLPNKGVASVYLHYAFFGGRLSVSSIAIVNHYPDRVQLFPTRALVYVDEGTPLQILKYRAMHRKRSVHDLRILSHVPERAQGKWLLPKPRFVTKQVIRGPTVVLFYGVEGHEGFVKVPFQALWDLPG